MDIIITLKNYRCFEDTKPARFVLQNGFTSFIGVNNAGKSSLLKFFHEFRTFFDLLSHPSGNLIKAIEKHERSRGFWAVSDEKEAFCNLNDRDLELEVEFRELFSPRVEQGENEIHFLSKVVITVSRRDLTSRVTLFIDNKKVDINEHSLDFRGTQFNIGKLVVDMLPVFETFSLLKNTLYIGPFRNAINSVAAGSYFDIQTGQSFLRAWDDYKTGSKKERNEAIFKLTEEIKSVFDFKSLEINTSPNDNDLQLFINGKSYTLSELGAGLAQFIIVLANVAMKEASFILIDEPELSLHPKLQTEFLRALGIYAKEGVLFATHSMGLARASSQRIYSVRVDKNGTHQVNEIEQLPSLAEFLGEIGFSAYRELGFDKLLLVEGPHDVTTMQELLRKWGKEHQVIILPLGGGSLINKSAEPQLLELMRITPNIRALIDSERESENDPLNKNIHEFVKACEKANIPCHVLKYRAMENYLTDLAVKKVKGDQYSALKPYEKLPPNQGWGKADIWKIAREMDKSELESTDLGEFLNKL